MNRTLINYIKKYIKESSAIPIRGRYIDAYAQHKLSPNIRKDMTGLSDEDVMKIIMQNIDERTCISFVNPYDKKRIPSFNINPHARYKTPHGNYAYPLTLENLRELIYTKKVKGAEFALQRPYFLLFKVNSPNALIINKDGSSNYKEIMSNRAHNKKTTRYDDLTLDKDIDRIIRTFIYFVRTLSSQPDHMPDWSSYDNVFFNYKLPTFYSSAEDILKSLINKDITFDAFTSQFGAIIRDFVVQCLSNKQNIPSDIEKKFFSENFKLLKEYLVELSESEVNRFYKGDDDTEDFHKVYFICWLLSHVGEVSNRSESNGPILTLLLKSVGIDAIIDQGSSTIHKSEPEQTVSLSFGNLEAKDIELLGTFKNIFKKSSEYIEELSAKIYKEEGFKYDIDFFSENKSPIGNISKSDIYMFLEDKLMSYHLNDTILYHGLVMEDGYLKIKFDLYADDLDYDISDSISLIEIISEEIIKSPHKHKIKIDLGITLFYEKANVDLTSVLNKLHNVSLFNDFMSTFSEGFLTLKNIGDNCFLNFNKQLIFKEFYIVVNNTCSFTLSLKERFFLDTIIKTNNVIKINTSAPITFDLLNLNLSRIKKMEKIPKEKKEKMKELVIKAISKKYPEAKVKI